MARGTLQVSGEQPVVLKLREEASRERREGVGTLRKEQGDAPLLRVLGG